jgi:hypothetical protein
MAMPSANLEIVRGGFAMVTIPGDPEPMIAASGPTFEMHLVGVTGEPVNYAGADGIRQFFGDELEDGRAARLRGFLDQTEALEAAGVADEHRQHGP